MTATAEKLRAELIRLSAQERAELARFLIDSLDQGADADAEAGWDAELDRRTKEIKSGKAAGKPAEEVFNELRAKYQ